MDGVNRPAKTLWQVTSSDGTWSTTAAHSLLVDIFSRPL